MHFTSLIAYLSFKNSYAQIYLSNFSNMHKCLVSINIYPTLSIQQLVSNVTGEYGPWLHLP